MNNEFNADAIAAMSDEDLSALGIQRIPEGDPDPIPLDDKLKGIAEALGGFAQPDGEELTPEQIEILENQFMQDVENKLYRMEKEVRAKYPDSTDDQQYEMARAVAKAVSTFEISEILDAADKIHKTIREKQEKESKEENENLRVEGEPTGGEGKSKGIPSIMNVFRNAAKAQ